VIGTVVLAAVAGLAATSQHANADTRVRKDRRIVKAAAERLTYSVIADAWSQHKLSNPAPLDALKSTVRLPYVGGREEAGGAVVLTFAAHRSTCVDLISSPITNTVRSRPGC
jgi:hypothetical protein